jgi:hypothetical protein
MKNIEISATSLILASFFLLNSVSSAFALTPPNYLTTGAEVTISASLGEPVLKLWGYGAPNSRVEMNGNEVSDFTYSKSDGYYEFLRAFLPAPNDLYYPELCLTGIDREGRATSPTCIPALPSNQFSYDIGPVILPPTLSLESGTTTPMTQIEANGITIPNSEVKIILAEDKGRSLVDFSIVKTAEAYYIPDYTVKSDNQGYFSFNMPDTSSDSWRVFAITNYSQGATSPKSNTLTFDVLSPTFIALESIWKFILSLLTLPGLIILEIVAILLIITIIFLTKRGKKKLPPNTTEPLGQYQI